MSTPINPPISPRVSTLPLSDMAWERFEAFSCDLLLALPWVDPATVHRYGTQGQAQKGIDLTLTDRKGQRWGFSNKRYRKYQPHHVGEHVDDTTYDADRYVILISGVASPEVRDEIRKHQKWELWDVEDLSARVRGELTPDAARRIVDHHFGTTWRRDFLGLPAVGAFLSPSDYFRPLLVARRLFHHSLSLVGREDHLTTLLAFTNDEVRRVAVLRGRGGIGKSRLLLEWARRVEKGHPDLAIRFASDGVPLSAATLDELPAAPCVIVVDDAHRRTDLGGLFAWIRLRPNARLLLTTRPQGLDYLQSQLSRTGFDTSETLHLQPLENLSRAEIRQLAVDVLGPEHASLVGPLTRATRDCPLLTVIGGRLLVDQPDLAKRDAEFRGEILNRFRDESLGSVSKLFPDSVVRKLLEFIAALAPVPVGLESLVEGLALVLDIPAPDVVRAVAELEKVGVLVRRGRKLRIVPDVLGDHILTEACITPQGQPTGFADQVFELFRTTWLDHLLRNLAELDWRARRDKGVDSGLLDNIWQRIVREFRDGDHRARVDILRQLPDSAYFLPGRVLELCQHAVANPHPSPKSGGCTHGTVLREIPPLLALSAFSPDHLRGSINLLWQLAQRDSRAPNPYPEHPFRKLTDIARCEPHKPLQMSEAVLARVRQWLSVPVDWDAPYTPFDVLDVLLERSGRLTESVGNAIHMTPYLLSFTYYREFRTAVMDVLERSVQTTEPRTLVRAVRSLGLCLSTPSTFGPAPLSTEDSLEWEPEQLRVLEILEQLIARRPHPLVLLAIVEQMREKRHIGPTARVRERAAEILSSITWTLELKLTRLLRRDTRWDSFEDQIQAGAGLSRDERSRAFSTGTAEETWQLFPDPDTLVTELATRVQSLRTLDASVGAGFLVGWLMDTNPSAAEPFLRKVIALGDSCIAECLSDGLAKLHQRDPATAIKLASEALDSNVLKLRVSAGHHLAWNLREQAASHGDEFSLIRRLVSEPAPELRRMGVEALRRIAPSSPREVLDLLEAVNSSGDPAIIQALCRLPEKTSGVPDHLSEADLLHILNRIEGEDSIEGSIVDFIEFASARVPKAVVEMLLRRIARDARSDRGPDYVPIPRRALREAFEALKDTEGHADLLRRVREAAQAAAGDNIADFARLFSDLSQRYQGVGLQVLEEWLTAGSADQVYTAARLWECAPSCFFADHLKLVERTLDHAESLGPECLSRVRRALWIIEFSRSRHGPSGQPFPQDVALRDRCRDILTKLDHTSLAAALIRDFMADAEANMKRAIESSVDEG